jgi:hypothetical protein
VQYNSGGPPETANARNGGLPAQALRFARRAQCYDLMNVGRDRQKTYRTRVLRLDSGDHASALQARFGCLQIPGYAPLVRALVGQKAEAAAEASKDQGGCSATCSALGLAAPGIWLGSAQMILSYWSLPSPAPSPVDAMS